jgi:ankyrin repeat protein
MDDLIKASRRGNLERVMELLKAGASVHARDDEALKYASWEGHFDVVKILLEVGANGSADNDKALRSASYKCHFEIVKILLDYGANKEGLHPDATPDMRGYFPVNRRRVCVCKN